MKWNLKYPPIIHTCLRCKEDFRIYESHLKMGMGKYCSRECSKPVVIAKCTECSKHFRTHPYKIKNGEAKYCSRKCRAISNGRKNIGINNRKWKGGITSSNKMQRRKFQQSIQKDVFKRDDYTCQLCGERGKKLQVDHIQSWAEHVELRFSLENCRTLCMKCHYKITFGRPMPKDIISWGHNLRKGELS